MAERSLSMREAPGSIPGLSTSALRVGGLYSSVGQSARLVSARSGVRTSLEAFFIQLNQSFSKNELCVCFCWIKIYPAITLARTMISHGRARRGSNTRPLDLQSNALPTAPQAPGGACSLNVQPLFDHRGPHFFPPENARLTCWPILTESHSMLGKGQCITHE